MNEVGGGRVGGREEWRKEKENHRGAFILAEEGHIKLKSKLH